MQTAIRKGKTLFYGDQVFPHGLSRSGYFNKRESEELLFFGETLSGLADGSLAPENDEEQLFVEELQSAQAATLYSVKLWQKYTNAVAKSKIHHGFAKSSQKDVTSIESVPETLDIAV